MSQPGSSLTPLTVHSRAMRLPSCPVDPLPSKSPPSIPFHTPSGPTAQQPRTAGKRFARRAKRWAELQQKRANGKHIIDYVELKELAGGRLPMEDVRMQWAKKESKERSSLPFSLLQPHTRRDVPLLWQYPSHSSLNAPLFVTRGFNEFGHETLISVYRNPPEVTVFPAVIRSQEDDGDLNEISVLASELAVSSLRPCSQAPSSLSASLSSNSSSSCDGEDLPNAIRVPLADRLNYCRSKGL